MADIKVKKLFDGKMEVTETKIRKYTVDLTFLQKKKAMLEQDLADVNEQIKQIEAM